MGVVGRQVRGAKCDGRGERLETGVQRIYRNYNIARRLGPFIKFCNDPSNP